MTTAAEPKKSLFSIIQDRAREVMKAMSEASESAAKKPDDEAGGEESKAEATDAKTVPVAPPDPDEIPPDTRAAAGSPSDGDLDDASKQAAAGAAAQDPPPGGDGDGDEGAGGGVDDGRPVEKAFDTHGNHDLTEEETRELLKANGAAAYGNKTGQAEPEELLKGGSDVEKLLVQLLEGLEDMAVRYQTAIDDIRAEVNRLTAGHSAQTRTLSKALKDLEALGQPKPKAITKAFPNGIPTDPAPASDLPPSDQFYLQMRTGKLSVAEAQDRLRESKGGGH